MKLFGYCRFSYFGHSDTGSAIKTIEDAHQYLYNQQRMNVRFHLFEHLLLPSLKAQTDKDFTLFVITSEIMPEKYHQRLVMLVSNIPQIKILVTDKTNLNQYLKTIIFENSDGGTQRTVQFRIDDDDALAMEFIEKLRSDSENLPDRTLISYPKGVLSFIDGDVARNCIWFKTYHAVGLATINGAGDLKNPFWIQHRRAFQNRPSFMDPLFCSHICNLHGYNNTLGHNPQKSLTNGVERRAVKNAKLNNPELLQEITTLATEEALREQFPYLTPKKLSDILLDCHGLL